MGIVDKYSLKYFLRLVCGNLCYVMLLFKNTPLHPICTTYDLKSPLRCPGTCLPLLCCPEKMATLWQGYGVETWVVSPPTNPNCTCYMLVSCFSVFRNHIWRRIYEDVYMKTVSVRVCLNTYRLCTAVPDIHLDVSWWINYVSSYIAIHIWRRIVYALWHIQVNVWNGCA